MVNKTIKFQYFKITYDEIKDGKVKEKGGFDVESWLNQMENSGKVQKLIELKNCSARIEKMICDANSGYWIVRFIKKRNTAPSKIRDGQDAEAIDLEEGEYIGEDVTMLYDRQNNTIMLQCNRLSLTHSTISELIEKALSSEQNKRINIRPITNDNRNIDFRNKQVRKFEVKLANVNDEIAGRSSLNKLFNIVSSYHGLSAKITLAVGRTKDKSLNNELIQNTVQDIQNNRIGVDSVRVAYKADSDSQMEVIDLFDDVKCSYIEIQQEDNKPLDFDILKTKMIEKYRNHL